jgi:hypothetical protein
VSIHSLIVDSSRVLSIHHFMLIFYFKHHHSKWHTVI